jgi:hypothetical protein
MARTRPLLAALLTAGLLLAGAAPARGAAAPRQDPPPEAAEAPPAEQPPPPPAGFLWPAPIAGGENPLLGSPWTRNGRGATPDARLEIALAGPGGTLARTATRPAGARPLLRGRLLGARGGPIAGALVIVAREVADRPGWRAVARVRTSSRGRFRALLSPGWASRRLGAVYWPTADAALPVFSRRALARVGPRVTFDAAAVAGGLVTMEGRVSGAALPAGGLLVELQVRNRGGWVGIRLVHADPSGWFSARYRFGARHRRFTLRAHVPRQTGWRLAAGAGPELRLAVR